MTIRLDALAVTERTGKDGTPKTYWTKIGSAFQTKDGHGWTVLLDALPMGGKILLKVPRERGDEAP